ncbi:hypothetical protein CLV62_13534 [Dysgonomonas alginatilytica]|uniref:Uncharacterized protein n=1 Tax=Dysgonomonas alginatilytica TaxID=1605892 RepID=A0A2V3PJH5_9BACT|nr:hypothetical protein [Dysgonomonas alginatilytica]PXV59462.1 hypothetical protein CLV62_13534 [Dysgonomonas alginatilytica]
MYREQYLREGNWIEVQMVDSNIKKHYGIVKEVGGNNSYLKVKLIESDEIIRILPDIVNAPTKLIPFTKEILLKNPSIFIPFINSDIVFYSDNDIRNSNSLDINISNNRDIKILYKNEGCIDKWMFLRIESQQLRPFTFVHELQNLYFELTNNELKILL